MQVPYFRGELWGSRQRQPLLPEKHSLTVLSHLITIQLDGSHERPTPTCLTVYCTSQYWGEPASRMDGRRTLSLPLNSQLHHVLAGQLLNSFIHETGLATLYKTAIKSTEAAGHPVGIWQT